jgi:hypothetical protein
VGPENLNPLDELKSLDQQVEVVNDLAGLKPIFFRLEEIAKQNVNDFEVQLAVGDIKQHLVNRGTKLKQAKEASPERIPTSTAGTIPVAETVATPPALPSVPSTTTLTRSINIPPPSKPPFPTQPAPPPPAPPPLPSGPPTLSGSMPASMPSSMPSSMSDTLQASNSSEIASLASSIMPVEPPPVPVPVGSPAGPPPLMGSAFGSQEALATTEHAPPAMPPPMPTAMPTRTPAPMPAMPSQRIPLPVNPGNASANIPQPPQPPQQNPPPPQGPPKPPQNWKRAIWIGAFVGAVIAVAGIIGLVNLARNRSKKEAASAQIQVQIDTTPPGASVRVTSANSGEQTCTSACKLALPAGNYQVTAFLDGYEPAASGVVLVAGQPASVSLALEPQAQSLRILTDLDMGKIVVDDQPPADLQEGQFVLDHIQPGSHKVTITSKTGEGSFSFDIFPAKQPSITGPVTAKNLNAVVVSSLGNQAHVVTNAGPLKLMVNGQPEADATPEGVDLKSFQAGVDELIVGEGKDQRNVKESFGPAPMLTAFFKSDLNIGTLIVSTGENDVHVFINNKETSRRTQRGQVRIQAIDKVSVRVAKDGFEAPPPQTAEVKKGDETRLEFKLKALPQFSSLQINGGTPGAEVLIDDKSVGTLGADGGFNNGTIAPGDHTIELRRSQFVPRRYPRSFKAGSTVTIAGGDAVLAADRPQPPPEKKVELPPPPKQTAAVTPPPPKVGTMADWEDNAQWKQDGDMWVHKGGGFLFYKLPAKGVFTFTAELLKGGSIFRGGKIRWVANYTGPKDYALFELDSKNFTPKVVMKGKTYERPKTPLKDMEKQKSFAIQIDITPDHIVHKMFMGGEWIGLDTWAEPGQRFSDGKFGLLVQGDDEIGLTNFTFQPK